MLQAQRPAPARLPGSRHPRLTCLDSPVATFDLLADLPLEIEGYELQGLEHQTPGFERLEHRDPPLGRRRGRARRGRHLRRARPRRPAGRRRDARPDRLRDAGRVLRVHRRGRHLPGRAAARGLAPLPPLGLRVGGARPGAAPVGHRHRRRARPRAAAGHLRLLDAARRRPRRALLDRDPAAQARPLSHACASSSTRPTTGPTS